MSRLIDADMLEPSEVYTGYGFTQIVYMDDIDEMPTVDIDAITESHERIGYDKGFRDGYAQATVDAEPVRHGRWLKNGNRYCECSVCHHEGNISGADNYCWYCGARMDEVSE